MTCQTHCKVIIKKNTVRFGLDAKSTAGPIVVALFHQRKALARLPDWDRYQLACAAGADRLLLGRRNMLEKRADARDILRALILY